MNKFRTFLVGFMIATTGCGSNIISDPTNTPTFTPTIDVAATESVIAAEETQSALETEEALTQLRTGTAEAWKTVYASTAEYLTLTASPVPSITPTPTSTATAALGSGSIWTSCLDATGGRTKVRVENKTGDVIYLSLAGTEERYCVIPVGVVQIFVKAGNYTVSATMCGQYRTFGWHVINSTWKIVFKC